MLFLAYKLYVTQSKYINKTETKQKQRLNQTGEGSILLTFYNKKNGVLFKPVVSRWLTGRFVSRNAFYLPLPLWRGGRCREFKIRVNVHYPFGPKKVTVVQRWPLVEVRL